MTLNNRLAMAAAAIVLRITMRRRPRVFLPVSPFKKGSIPVEAMAASASCNDFDLAMKSNSRRGGVVHRMDNNVSRLQDDSSARWSLPGLGESAYMETSLRPRTTIIIHFNSLFCFSFYFFFCVILFSFLLHTKEMELPPLSLNNLGQVVAEAPSYDVLFNALSQYEDEACLQFTDTQTTGDENLLSVFYSSFLISHLLTDQM